MAPRLKLAVARLWHEGNSFNPLPIGMGHFRAREWCIGEAAAALYAGTATELGAAVAFAEARPDWDVEFLRCASAPPGGPVDQPDLDAICEEIVDGLAGQAWDAVYLSLHGALLGTRDLNCDRTLLTRVRGAVGPHVPIAVTFDMHACLAPAVAGLVQILVGYKTYPHVDMFETGAKALGLLERAVRGKQGPRVMLRPVPFLPNSHRMRTDSGPMADLVRKAASLENAAGLLDVTMFGGFAYADTPHAHATVSVCYNPPSQETAHRIAEELAADFLSYRERFTADLPDAREGLAHAVRLLDGGTRWPVAVTESSDNPLSGGLGDTTGLFRALIEAGIDKPSLFAFFHDPDLVARAFDAGEGATVSAALGGRVTRQFGTPVSFEARVAKLTDGRFTNSGPIERGMPVSLGRTAVLERGHIGVVIAETCQGVYDPSWCELHGVDLSRIALFCVKAKNHFHAAFAPRCGAIIDVDTPGPAPADLNQLDYRHVPLEHRMLSGRPRPDNVS